MQNRRKMVILLRKEFSMNLHNLTIRDIIEGYEKHKFTSQELFTDILNYIEKNDLELNAFITKRAKEQILVELTNIPMAIPIAHKDIYSTKGLQTTAASNILKGYIPPFNATSVERLAKNNFVTIGKLNCDAFAHGATGENSDYGPTLNPYDLTKTPGGSSSGSAAAVAAGFVPVATGTDTGGSIRLPASFTNTVGIKPTYGRVSRYGIIAMTSSTDSIGHFTKTVWDNAYILSKTAGFDSNDATSSHENVSDYLSEINKGVNGVRIGIPREYLINIDPAILVKFNEVVDIYKRLGAEIFEVSLPNTEYAINAYYIITPSEVSSNLARFDGIRFGFDRSQFGQEAKRRILIGTYCLSAGYYDAYYLKAQKVRTLIINEFKNTFKNVDVLLAPVSPIMPPKIGELTDDPLKLYMMDVLTVPVNLAGIPSLSIPAGFSDNLPIGIQIIGNYFDEKLLYQVGQAFETETQYYKQTPKYTREKND